MSQQLSLKEAERKAFRSTFQDGLWDIFLGLLLLGMGFGEFLVFLETPVGWIFIPVVGICVLALFAFWAGKKFITTPRLGLVKFGPQRKAKVKKVRVALAIVVLLSVIAALVGGITFVLVGKGIGRGGSLLFIPMSIWVLQCSLAFGLGAYFLDVNRFYAYGLLYAIPLPVGFALARSTHPSALVLLAFGISAGVMLLVGVILFFRFVRDYPLPAEEPLAERALGGNH